MRRRGLLIRVEAIGPEGESMNTAVEYGYDFRGMQTRTAATSVDLPAPTAGPPIRSLAIIDSRPLARECLAQSISSHPSGMPVVTFSSVDDWETRGVRLSDFSAILLHIGSRQMADRTVEQEIRDIVASGGWVPVVILSDAEDLTQILLAMECGAKGYIPPTAGIDVCIEAILLALAGGSFVPVASLVALRQTMERVNATKASPLNALFTLRQVEVVDALRKGKANKIIAYELNLRESTVKVHIRNIMRKLKATNRTEVAYKLSILSQ